MEDGPWDEVLEPLSDPLLSRCIEASYQKPTLEQRLDSRFYRLVDWILDKEIVQKEASGEVIFVPTGAMALLEILHQAKPNHSIIVSDFDFLPEVIIPGKNAPLVAEKIQGRKIDHDSLYVPWGTADIFFPTDFDALGRVYRAAAEKVWSFSSNPEVKLKLSTSHFHQGAVMKRYKEMAKTATIGSFNPMVDDFLNARFFFADTEHSNRG